MAQQIDYFVREPKSEIYSHDHPIVKEVPGDRTVVLIGPISESEYLARTSWSRGMDQTENTEHERYVQVPISIVDRVENILRDSLHIAEGPNSVTITRARSIFPVGTPPYLFHDRIRLIEDGRYFIARPESKVIHIYNQNHTLDHSIELNAKSRPIQNKDIEFNLEDVDEQHRNLLIRHIPNYKPVFLDVWVSETHFLLHVDSNKKGRQFVALSIEGEPLGKFYLSEYDEVKQFIGNFLYTIHRSPTGHTIRKYSLGIL